MRIGKVGNATYHFSIIGSIILSIVAFLIGSSMREPTHMALNTLSSQRKIAVLEAVGTARNSRSEDISEVPSSEGETACAWTIDSGRPADAGTVRWRIYSNGHCVAYGEVRRDEALHG